MHEAYFIGGMIVGIVGTLLTVLFACAVTGRCGSWEDEWDDEHVTHQRQSDEAGNE